MRERGDVHAWERPWRAIAEDEMLEETLEEAWRFGGVM